MIRKAIVAAIVAGFMIQPALAFNAADGWDDGLNEVIAKVMPGCTRDGPQTSWHCRDMGHPKPTPNPPQIHFEETAPNYQDEPHQHFPWPSPREEGRRRR
jgi:hypothetical protein